MALPDTSNPLLLWHKLLLCRRTERGDRAGEAYGPELLPAAAR
jgi:hypothetical protein